MPTEAKKVRGRPWAEIRDRNTTPARMAKIRRLVAKDLLDMDLRAIRQVVSKTPVDVAGALKVDQSLVSKMEARGDHLVSTLRRYVEALGGELEIVATFGDRRVRLRTAG